MVNNNKGDKTTSKGGSSSNNTNTKSGTGKALLSVRYPVNSTWEFTLPNDEVAKGTVYCTDEVSQIVVLQTPLVHTTLAFEVRMVNVASIEKEKLISSSTENSASNTNEEAPLSKPLPVIQKKVLEEREKKAIKLAEERFRHINQNVSCFFHTIIETSGTLSPLLLPLTTYILFSLNNPFHNRPLRKDKKSSTDSSKPVVMTTLSGMERRSKYLKRSALTLPIHRISAPLFPRLPVQREAWTASKRL